MNQYLAHCCKASTSRRRSTMSSMLFTIAVLCVITTLSSNDVLQLRIGVSASAIAPPIMAARLGTKTRNKSSDGVISTSSTSSASTATTSIASADSKIDASTSLIDGASTSEISTTSTTSTPSTNPIAQLANYIKTTAVNFKNGLGQMNTDHRRCNDIRTKQRNYAKSMDTTRPRGTKGIQTGGISYGEYDFLRKGLVDRNKLFAVVMVSLCLPNYFVYYLWSFPDMLPSPFLKPTDTNEISRVRNHAVINTLLDIEKGARVAPWSSKLNPFGKKATERGMVKLTNYINVGCNIMEKDGASGPSGGKMVLKKLKPILYTSKPLTKQQKLLVDKEHSIPKQVIKGLTKAIGADPLNKGSSPFGIGAVKHIESVTLVDEFLVNENINVDEISDQLLEEACSARLIGGTGWTTDERREALTSWLYQVEIKPRTKCEAMMKQQQTSEGEGNDDNGGGASEVYFNGNLARAALMCYNAMDATRDTRADSRLLRVMYQGQKKEFILN